MSLAKEITCIMTELFPFEVYKYSNVSLSIHDLLNKKKSYKIFHVFDLVTVF